MLFMRLIDIVDSTGVMELVQFIEEQHGISVEDEDMLPENLDSIENVARFVHRKLDARAVNSNAAEGAEL